MTSGKMDRGVRCWGVGGGQQRGNTQKKEISVGKRKKRKRKPEEVENTFTSVTMIDIGGVGVRLSCSPPRLRGENIDRKEDRGNRKRALPQGKEKGWPGQRKKRLRAAGDMADSSYCLSIGESISHET